MNKTTAKCIVTYACNRKCPGGYGLIHDSRGDVRLLAQVCNALINKCDELTERVNILTGMLEEKIEEANQNVEKE